MARTRISTTVDSELLDDARNRHTGATDAQLIDHALSALLAQYRAAEIDAAYEVAYRDHPIDEVDDWGDLAAFRGSVERGGVDGSARSTCWSMRSTNWLACDSGGGRVVPVGVGKSNAAV